MLVTFLVFAATALLGLIIAIIWFRPRIAKVSTVPGLDPRDNETGNIQDIPEAGSFHEFLSDLHGEFGEVASFWYGPQYCVSVANADTFRDIQALTDRPALLFEFVAPLIGKKSIQFANGEDGMKRHKMAVDALGHHASKNLLSAFVEISKDLANSWAQKPRDEQFPIHEYMMALAIKMISKTQFGAYFRKDENIKKLFSQYEDLMERMDNLLIGKFSEKDTAEWNSFQKTMSDFKSEIKTLIAVQRKALEENDFEVAPLLNALLDSAKDEEELLGDVIAFMVGGFHTTGNLLTWFFYYVSMHKDVQEKVFQEMKDVLGEEDVNPDNFNKLKYTNQVLDETLRLSITGPFAARVSLYKDIRIGGHLVPMGIPIVNALGVSLRDTKFFEAPETFDPERFTPESTKKRPSLAFVPFGIGQRQCPGYKFAKFEFIAIATVLLRRFKFELAFENDIYIKQVFGFVTKPETEVWLKIEKR